SRVCPELVHLPQPENHRVLPLVDDKNAQRRDDQDDRRGDEYRAGAELHCRGSRSRDRKASRERAVDCSGAVGSILGAAASAVREAAPGMVTSLSSGRWRRLLPAFLSTSTLVEWPMTCSKASI